MTKKTILLIFLSGIIIGLITGGAIVRHFDSTPVSHNTDTVTQNYYYCYTDTVRKSVPVYRTKKVIDTLRIPCKDNVCEVNIEQVEYKDTDYSAWVSGYKPVLDSIKVYRKTQVIEHDKIINHTTTVVDTKDRIFAGVSVQKIESTYVPSVHLFYETCGFLFGGNVGLYNNKPIYGLNVNYKLK